MRTGPRAIPSCLFGRRSVWYSTCGIPGEVWCKVPCVPVVAPVQTVRHCLDVAAHERDELKKGILGSPRRPTVVGCRGLGGGGDAWSLTSRCSATRIGCTRVMSYGSTHDINTTSTPPPPRCTPRAEHDSAGGVHLTRAWVSIASAPPLLSLSPPFPPPHHHPPTHTHHTPHTPHHHHHQGSDRFVALSNQ